jgi:hypothetical protein
VERTHLPFSYTSLSVLSFGAWSDDHPSSEVLDLMRAIVRRDEEMRRDEKMRSMVLDPHNVISLKQHAAMVLLARIVISRSEGMRISEARSTYHSLDGLRSELCHLPLSHPLRRLTRMVDLDLVAREEVHEYDDATDGEDEDLSDASDGEDEDEMDMEDEMGVEDAMIGQVHEDGNV